MKTSSMLHAMCHQVLSDADIKAICKSRGFSSREAASRALFENFYLSEIGVRSALDRLTGEEKVFLHLIRFIAEPVGISLFGRLYNSPEPQDSYYYYRTFSKRYKSAFQSVQRNLVRAGVLLMAETENADQQETKMEKWRFWFPDEFARFLPPLTQSALTLEGEGEVHSQVARRKLIEVTSNQQPSDRDPYALTLSEGELRIGGQPFCVARWLEWQHSAWATNIPQPHKSAKGSPPPIPGQNNRIIPPAEAAMYVLSRLGENDWLPPESLSLPLKLFCHATISAVDVCSFGWEWGCLARQIVNRKAYYRLPQQPTQDNPSPGNYLTAQADPPVTAALERIPYSALEHLASIARLDFAAAPGCLSAWPDLIKLGRAPQSAWDHPLTHWLYDNIPAFCQAIDTMQQRWGKHIIHENVMIARVDDIALKVQLERAFPDPSLMLFLPNDYLVFPRALTDEVEKFVARAGYVIKRKSSNG